MQKEKIRWITVKGTHIPIKEGQTAKEATATFFARQNASYAEIMRETQKTVEIKKDRDIFRGVAREDYGRTVREYMRTHFRGKTINDTNFTKISETEYTHSRSSQKLYNRQEFIYDAKMQAATELDNIVKESKFVSHEEAVHPHRYNQNGYDRYKVAFSIDGKQFTGELLVAIDSNERRVFYDIVNIKNK